MKPRLLPAILAALAILLVSGSQRPPLALAQTSVPRNAVVCTTSPTGSFELTATVGYARMSDGNVIFMWGYANGDANPATLYDRFQYPGPILCVNQGDTVTITLHNTLGEDTSLVFPGQEGVTVGGQPSQPVFDTAGAMTSLAPVAAAGTGTQTYSFTASEPGTYIYQSGTNAGVQVQMGLFGLIIVRPSGHPDWAYNRADSAFNPDSEYVSILSEIDPYMHQAYELGTAFNMQSYRARYFLINGRAFPDTLADNGVAWLPNQPYSALVHIYPYDPSSNAIPSLVRYVGVGTEDFPFHPHGNHSRVIGRDGRALATPTESDLSYEKFSLPVGPGQTWDITFDWRDDENYSISNPISVQVPSLQNIMVGPYWSGSPYLGNSGPRPPGETGFSQCSEFYHIAHNHALQQMTSWGGITLSGQATYTRIDPPLPNSCP